MVLLYYMIPAHNVPSNFRSAAGREQFVLFCWFCTEHQQLQKNYVLYYMLRQPPNLAITTS